MKLRQRLRQRVIDAVRAQFGRPTGLWGIAAGLLMAHRTSSRDTTCALRLRFEGRCAMSRPAARPQKPVGRPNWARTASIALCLSSIRLTSLTSRPRVLENRRR